MSDIDLYEKSADSYEELQEKRPDYSRALKSFLTMATEALKGKSSVSIVDFCCGMGNNTLSLSNKIDLNEAVLIDINKRFLEIAKGSGIKSKRVEIIESDILDVELQPVHDAVISMFAYHHVPDDKKQRYVELAKEALKKGGALILGEIYSPNAETTVSYYNDVFAHVAPGDQSAELESFLKQTAGSTDFEYKVPREFAHDQFRNAGFSLTSSQKIWPEDQGLPKDAGMFLEVWKKN